jgi:myxalamid-type polyketide synthase MxaE and MxaD
MSSHFGVFLDKIEYFDANLFRISDAQASHIDPQQRMLLECSFETYNDIDCGDKKKTGRK